MKEIRAVIQPARLEALRERLRKLPGFPGMTVTQAQGSGYHPGMPAPKGIRGELADYAPRIRVEIVAEDAEVDTLVRAIHEAAHTGRPGDGVVWVVEVAAFLRLRVPPG